MPQFQADQKPTILIISIRRFADVTVRQIRVVEERGQGKVWGLMRECQQVSGEGGRVKKGRQS